jgi:hypothetical protein
VLSLREDSRKGSTYAERPSSLAGSKKEQGDDLTAENAESAEKTISGGKGI